MIDYYELYANKDKFWKDVIVLGLYGLTTLTSLFGNSIVCYVAFVLRSRSRTYLLIGNMAVSDLISAIVIPSQWIFCSTTLLDHNERLCSIFKTLQVVSYFISTFTMALIAIDRFMILRNPLASRIRPLLSITWIWILSMVLNIPTQFTMRVPEYFTANKLISCRIILKTDLFPPKSVRRFRVSLIIIVQYFIPALIAAILYGLCIKKILARQRLGENTDVQQQRFYQSKKRTIKMMLISLLAFTMSWFPVHFVHFIDFYIVPLLSKECNSSFYYNLVYWLSISSCCYNPFIYCWFDQKFKTTAKQVCCCCWFSRRNGRHNNQESSGQRMEHSSLT